MTTAAKAERVRARKPDTEPVEPGKLYATLTRGVRYLLIGRSGTPDQLFLKGERREVDQATYDRLAAAVDHVTIRDPEYGRVSRQLRKFRLSPPLPEIASETCPDGAEVQDYA